MKRNRIYSTILSYIWITAGCFIYAVSFDWFFAPNDIAYGGVTGVAQIAHEALPMVGIGVLIIIFNLPLFLAGWKWLGFGTLVSSLYAMGVSSVLIDLLNAMIPFPTAEPLLASLYGGVSLGVALGMIFRQGATTGGTDIGARLLKRRLQWLPTGQLLMVIDLVVICGAAIVFRKLDSALYGIVALAISTIVMDKVLYGLDNTKVAYIISDSYEKILEVILHDMDRSATLLSGEGAFTRTDKPVILCAFPQRQIVTLKKAVREIDANAFVIVCQANEVLGDGFRSHTEEF